MLRKSVDWFLYDNVLRHERVKKKFSAEYLESLKQRKRLVRKW